MALLSVRLGSKSHFGVNIRQDLLSYCHVAAPAGGLVYFL